MEHIIAEWELIWADRERIRRNARARKWRQKNLESRRAYDRKYQRAWNAKQGNKHRDYARLYSARRSAVKKALPNTLTDKEWCIILKAHKHRCHYCGCKSDRLEMEHIIPIIKGGGLTKDNIVPACRGCNSSKNAKEYAVFINITAKQLQLL